MSRAITLLPKLLARALDPAASAGEAENSACAAIRAARAEGMDTAAFAAALGGPVHVEYRDRVVYRDRAPVPDWFKTATFPFGKHEGRRIVDVFTTNPGYLIWFANTIHDCDSWTMTIVKHYADLAGAKV